MTIETRNARITKTQLGTEDHGIFTFWLYTESGGTGQGVGGYAIGFPDCDREDKWPVSLELIHKILQIVGVDSWEDLSGKYIRVKADWEKVYAIGNILEDRWLNFGEYFSELKGGTK